MYGITEDSTCNSCENQRKNENIKKHRTSD